MRFHFRVDVWTAAAVREGGIVSFEWISAALFCLIEKTTKTVLWKVVVFSLAAFRGETGGGGLYLHVRMNK